MDEPAKAQSAPSAAGAPRGLIAKQVRLATIRLLCLALARGPVRAPLPDERRELAHRLLTTPSGKARQGVGSQGAPGGSGA